MKNKEKFMQEAVNAALKGMQNNEGGPFGCVIVKDGKIIYVGDGAGAKAFARLGIEAADLAELDAAERIKLIQERISAVVPAAEQAAVASQVSGDKTGLAMLRLDAATIDKATDEIERFGVAVSDMDTDKVEEANDAISALGLVTKGLGNQMAVALAPKRIRVNAVAFGSVMSASLKGSLSEDDDMRDAIVENTPLHRIASPGEVSDAVQYLASDAAGFVTGQIITVDGGRTLIDPAAVSAH